MAHEADPGFSKIWENADKEHRATHRNIVVGAIASVATVAVLAFGVNSCAELLRDDDPVRQANVDRCIGHLRNLPPPTALRYENAVLANDPTQIEVTIHDACEAANGNSITAIDFWATALNSTTTTQQG